MSSIPIKQIVKKDLKRHFLAGLVVVVPLGMTLLVVRWIVSTLDNLLLKVTPSWLDPGQVLGFTVPGMGLLMTAGLIVLVGMTATNYFGKTLLSLSERLMQRIPLIKGIYNLFKQVADTMLNGDNQGFRRPVLVEYPRKGLWSLGFVTGQARGEIQKVSEESLVNVFVPTTPNPTSGFYFLSPEKDVTYLDMSAEDAFKLLVSGGMVVPPENTPAETL